MLQIQNKITFENNCWVGTIDPTEFNSNYENRIFAVTDIASISKGRLGLEYEEEKMIDFPCKRRENLYNRLLKESAGNPSVPFEFVPIFDINLYKYIQDLYEQVDILKLKLRNMRITDLSIKIIENKIKLLVSVISNIWRTMNLRTYTSTYFNKPEELKNFKIIVGRVPMKVITHLRTHRSFSFIVESSRNKKYLDNVELWYPSGKEPEIIKRWINRDDQLIKILYAQVNDNVLKPDEATMELSDRRLVLFAMSAWKNDPFAWENLFKVRGDKTGTMNITNQTVNNIKKLIYG